MEESPKRTTLYTFSLLSVTAPKESHFRGRRQDNSPFVSTGVYPLPLLYMERRNCLGAGNAVINNGGWTS
jgi:hypothetical protein